MSGDRDSGMLEQLFHGSSWPISAISLQGNQNRNQATALFQRLERFA